VPLVVRQLQVGDHRPVPVGPLGLPQVHTYTTAHIRARRRVTRPNSCAYTSSRSGTTCNPLTSTNALSRAALCLRLRKSGLTDRRSHSHLGWRNLVSTGQARGLLEGRRRAVRPHLCGTPRRGSAGPRAARGPAGRNGCPAPSLRGWLRWAVCQDSDPVTA
jgi:hypothetical protein